MIRNAPRERVARDLLLTLGVVFAALQVLPSYVSSKSLLVPLVVFTLVCGAFGFLLLRFAKFWRSPRWKSVLLVVLFLANFGFALYSQYSVRKRDEQIASEQESLGASGPLRKYLNDVFDEHNGQWGGDFERRYARPTLFQLTEDALKDKPSDVQESILLWRTGFKIFPDYFMGLSCFVQRDLREVKENADKVAEKFLHYVSRPLADSDLLNKRRPTQRGEAPAADDIPYRVLVLGDPASGKSTMLDRLDMIQARRARGSKEEPVPVLIRLKGFDAPSRETLLEKIRERLGPAADIALQRRTIILLIDALDESSDPRKAASAISDLLREDEFKEKVDRTIVTARVLEYSVDLYKQPQDLTSSQNNFKTVLLYGLDQTAIEKQILGSNFKPAQKQRVLQKFADPVNGELWLQFLRLPMNFDLISEIMVELDSNDIPRVPSDIVGRFVKRRFIDKKIVVSDSDHCQNILSGIAAALLTDVSKRSRPFSAEDCANLARSSQDIMPIDPEAAKARLQQIEKTGLIKREPRTTDKYRFFHLNLQDYFGARGLRDISVIDPKDVAWRQVILFRAGFDGDALSKLIKQAQTALASTKGDGNRKEKEAYLQDLLLEVDSIRTAARHTGNPP
jgi:hypothetical protein